MSVYGVLLFYTTSAAMRAEKVLERAGVVGRLVPVPRHLSSDCAVALRVSSTDEKRVRALLASARVEVAAVARLEE